MKYGFGIDLGGTTVKIAYFDENGTMLEKWEIPTVTADGGQQILPDIAASIRAFLEAHNINETNVLGLGIGVPGPVNAKGVVNKCVNLGWGVFNISETLSKLTGFSVKAGNDANVAALGEFWKGGGRGCDNMVFVTLGTGVGGGIVVEGIVRLMKEYLAQNESSSSLSALENPTCKDIFDAAKAGDAAANAVLDRVYAYMGLFLGNVCSTVNPEVVVLGGGVSKAGDMLLRGVEPYFHKHVFHAASGAKFALASLGNDAGAYGAFKLALDAFGA